MTTDLFGTGFTIKIPNYASESIAVALLQANGLSVSKVSHFYLSMNRRTHRILGLFNTGVQPMGTPITAELVQGGGVDINVTWRDEEGRVAGKGWCKSSGWDLPNANSARRPSDGRN